MNLIKRYLLLTFVWIGAACPLAVQAETDHNYRQAGKIQQINPERRLIQIDHRWYQVDERLVVFDVEKQQVLIDMDGLDKSSNVGFRVNEEHAGDPQIITHIWLTK